MKNWDYLPDPSGGVFLSLCPKAFIMRWTWGNSPSIRTISIISKRVGTSFFNRFNHDRAPLRMRSLLSRLTARDGGPNWVDVLVFTSQKTRT